MQFSLRSHAAPFRPPAVEQHLVDLLQAAQEALMTDPHLRASFAHVFLARLSPTPSDEEQAAFLSHFQTYLSTLLPTVRLEATQTFGFTKRPSPGQDAVIRINNSLAYAAAVRPHPDPTLARVVFLVAMFHELAHTYGFFVRPGSGYSPPMLTVSGYEDEVPRRDSAGNVVVDATGAQVMVKIGEAGFCQEQNWNGGILVCVCAADSMGQADLSRILSLQLDREGVLYDVCMCVCFSTYAY
jgi:hypothetical protein